MSLRLRVRVAPRSGRDAIDGLGDDGLLRVRVAAAPADGAANAAVVRVIARHAGVAPSRVRIIAGGSARVKTIEVECDDDEAVLARLSGAADAS